MPVVETCIDTAAPAGEADPLAEAEVAPPADTPEAVAATGIVAAEQPDDAVTAAVTDAVQQPAIEAPELEASPQEPAAHVDAAPPTPADRGPATAQSRQQPAWPRHLPRRRSSASTRGRRSTRAAWRSAPRCRCGRSRPGPAGTGGKDRGVHPGAADGGDRCWCMADRTAFGSVPVAPLDDADAVRSHRRRLAAAAHQGTAWRSRRTNAAADADRPLDDGPLAGQSAWGA